MTNEERDIIGLFIQRISGAAPSGPGATAGAQGGTPALPPIDPEADQFIAALLQHFPEARYRLTQTAYAQQAALAEAQTRLQRLEVELAQTRIAAQNSAAALAQLQAQMARAAPQAAPAPARGGFLGGMFGGAAPAAASVPATPPPSPWGAAPAYAPAPTYAAPTYAPPPQMAPPMGAMPAAGGTGFLGSALTTAAGVAGGMVAGNVLMDMFSPHREFGGGFGGQGFGGQGFGAPGMPTNETIINNYAAPASPDTGRDNPWAADPANVAGQNAPTDQGYWSKDAIYGQDMPDPDPAPDPTPPAGWDDDGGSYDNI